MLALYYRIWVDVIMRAKSRPESRENWPAGTMIFMSVAMTLNFFLIMTILQKHIIGSYFYHIDLNFLPKRLNNVINFIVLFILPCVFVNYFLIFYKHKYRELLKKYPYRNGKLFLVYFTISMFLPLALLIVGIATGVIRLSW
jgi:energy-coupling factor transporter transmembrane protein EcfT